MATYNCAMSVRNDTHSSNCRGMNCTCNRSLLRNWVFKFRLKWKLQLKSQLMLQSVKQARQICTNNLRFALRIVNIFFFIFLIAQKFHSTNTEFVLVSSWFLLVWLAANSCSSSVARFTFRKMHIPIGQLIVNLLAKSTRFYTRIDTSGFCSAN